MFRTSLRVLSSLLTSSPRFPDREMEVSKVLLLLDFDHTIIDDNSDTWIRKLLPNGKVSMEIKNNYKKHGSWTSYMADIFVYLHQSGVQKKDILDCFRDIPFTPGMLELLKYQQRAPSVDTIIVSDSNSLFITNIMEGGGLADAYKEMYTNPADFDADGCLKIQHHHQHDCQQCPSNLCKGMVLKKYLTKMMQSGTGIAYDRVVVVGDGSNDFCPCVSLGENDFVFPRKGYNLIKKIEQYTRDNGQKLKATVIPWDSGHDIIQYLQGILG